VLVKEQRSSKQRQLGNGLGRWLLLFIVVPLAFAILGAGLPWAAGNTGELSTATRSTRCPAVILYFSRGSGQRPALNSPGIELYRALWKRYGRHEVARVENGYPAVPVTSEIRGRKLPDLRFGRYRKSVAQGVTSARVGIRDLVSLCPQSHLILGGYSQGAQVTRITLGDLTSREQARVAAVLLFGDPYFNPKEDVVTYFPSENRKRHGILVTRFNARSIRISPRYRGRIFSWCHRRDIICQGQGRVQKGQHGNYDDDIPAVMRQIAPLLDRLKVKPSATTYTYAVAGACVFDTCALEKWNGPGKSFEPVGSVGEGEPVKVVCQTVGEIVAGENGLSSDIWDQLDDGAFVPDYYVSTPGAGAPSAPIPSC
jgi:cutinase-like protein